MNEFTIIGVPIDSVGRSGGTEGSPRALRELGLVEALGAADRGDLDVRVRGEERDPETGLLGSDDVLATTAAVRRAVGEALAADMPISVALGHGPAAWVEAGGGASLAPERTVLLGYRDAAESREYGMAQPDEIDPAPGCIPLERVRALGPHAAAESAIASLGTGTPLWLHFDVDVLDEVAFPATDYLMPEGLTWEELRAMLPPLLTAPDLIGASIACYNPEKDPGEACGRALVEALNASRSG